MTNFKGVVLVVEDHPVQRMAIAEALTEAGFEALEAGSAAEAIGVLEGRSDIHLVFTDVEMPGTMDGVELAHYIRNRWPPVKLIFVSGKGPVGADRLPAQAKFFSKPYREASILEAMVGMISGAG
jgi:two-component system, response regulator PdtaR